jgi:hypothetical protein
MQRNVWMWAGFMCLRLRSIDGLLLTRYCKFGFYNRKGISWPAGGLSASEGLRFVALLSYSDGPKIFVPFTI